MQLHTAARGWRQGWLAAPPPGVAARPLQTNSSGCLASWCSSSAGTSVQHCTAGTPHQVCSNRRPAAAWRQARTCATAASAPAAPASPSSNSSIKTPAPPVGFPHADIWEFGGRTVDSESLMELLVRGEGLVRLVQAPAMRCFAIVCCARKAPKELHGPRVRFEIAQCLNSTCARAHIVSSPDLLQAGTLHDGGAGAAHRPSGGPAHLHSAAHCE